MSTSGQAVPDTEPDPDFEPEDVRYIRDVETLKAHLGPDPHAHPGDHGPAPVRPAWSVKELAAALDLPQTRLYHHVELLQAQDLVRAVERRVVSGIIETRYAVTARSFQLDRTLFTGDSEESLAGPARHAACRVRHRQDRGGARDPPGHRGPRRERSAGAATVLSAVASPG